MKQLKILESYDAEWVKNEIRHQYEILSFQLASDKNNEDLLKEKKNLMLI